MGNSIVFFFLATPLNLGRNLTLPVDKFSVIRFFVGHCIVNEEGGVRSAPLGCVPPFYIKRGFFLTKNLILPEIWKVLPPNTTKFSGKIRCLFFCDFIPDGWHRTVGQSEVRASITTVFFFVFLFFKHGQ